MKKLFTNRGFLVCLTVVLMIASVLLNTRVKFGKKCNNASASFYAENSVADSLSRFCDASEELVELGLRCQIDDADAPMEEIREIRNSLSVRSMEYDDLFEEYEALLRKTFALEGSLERNLPQLNDEAVENFTSARHNASEAKAAVDACDYNTRVAAFLKANSHFPTPQLADLSGVKVPELFA